MDNQIEEVKKRIDIVEYIGSSVQLKKAGRNFKSPCPFHQEKTPSFVVSPDRQIWRCFGACQEGGDVISFLMKWENITFFEALQELAKQAGVTLKNVNFEDKKWEKKEALLEINNLAVKFFNYLLTKHVSGKSAREYLKDRDIDNKLIKTFQLGYAPKSWDSLISYLKKKGYSSEQILATGLVIKNQNGRYYDRFRGRLMFPIADGRGNIVGFSGRLLNNEDKQAKYVNTPETELYRKRETLFGINVARKEIRKQKYVIVTEGEFDMISSFKHGLANTVAIKGSAFTKEQLSLLKKYTQHIILALDADFSGTETTKKAIHDAEKLEFRIDVARFKNGKDPDEALQNDPLGFKKAIKKPLPIYDFVIEVALERYPDKTAYAKKGIGDMVMPFLFNITNPIVKTHYIRRLSEILEMNEIRVDAMLSNLNIKYKKKETPFKLKKEKKDVDRFENLQKYVMSTVLQRKNPITSYSVLRKILSLDDFSVPAYQKLLKSLEEYSKNNTNLDVNSFTNSLSAPLQSTFDELFLVDTTLIHEDGPDLERSLYELKKFSLKHKLKKELAKENSGSTSSSLTKELSEVEKKLAVS